MSANVTHNYGSNVTVVFDGYTSGPSTKDHEHIRRADTVICSTTLQKAAAGETVTVVADDTDILVLLVYHWQPFMAEPYMKREARGTFRSMTISIATVKQNIGHQAAQ